MKQLIGRVALVLVVLVAAAGFAIITGRPLTQAVPKPSPANSAALDIGDTVQAAGVFASASQATLSFQYAGRVSQINVKEGDQVKSGQLLAALDTRMLEDQAVQAQAALDAARAKLDQLQNPSPADVAASQSNVASTEAALAQLQTPTQNDVLIAKADFDNARTALNAAQAAYDRIGGNSNPFSNMAPQAIALQQASSSYQRALAAYNAKVSPSEAQLKQALAAVAQAHDQYSRLTSPSPDDLKAAQAAVDQARAALELAKDNLKNAQIVAPFDAAVTWIGPHVGESVSVTPLVPAIMLADLDHMQVKVVLDESTFGRVKLGQAAKITVRALPGATLTGKVTKIGLQATTTAGAVSVPVTIDVDPSADLIEPGLSAVVDLTAAPASP